MDECQHSFEMLIDAFVHAEQGTMQPQLIAAEKIRNLVKNQNLPTGTDYPLLPFSELSKIITPKCNHRRFKKEVPRQACISMR
jgi:hypothetical protein